MSELRASLPTNPRCPMSVPAPVLATSDDVIAAFDALDDAPWETLRFELVENPPFPWRDLCAFLLLASWVPAKHPGARLISCAAHDEFWLEIGTGSLAGKVTADDVLTLVRCGVRCDPDGNLRMNA